MRRLRTPASPMVGRYLIRNRKWNAVFHLMDAALRVLPKASRVTPRAPGKLLLANPAHLGDVLCSTSVLPVLKAAFPDLQIGFLIGSWSEAVLRDHPLVDRVHVVDHYLANRHPATRLQRLRRHRQTRCRALAEIRAVGYDAAVDLYSFFPNFIPLLWQARIPVRIGYSSGGFGPLLTHEVRFPGPGQHETVYQANLLRVLPVPAEAFAEQQPTLPPPGGEAHQELQAFLSAAALHGLPYRVLHLGTGGSALREWPIAAWRRLAQRLVAEGQRLVFTGLGARERAQIEEVAAGLPHCVNACDALGWGGFLAALQQADLVYSVETSAGHLAAALGTPCVSLYSGMHGPDRWRPLGEDCRLVTVRTPCSPCYRWQGCEGMECIRRIRPETVYEAGEELLARGHHGKRCQEGSR